MLAAQQRVQEAHDAFPPAVKKRAGLLISYFNASSKAFVPQRKIPFVAGRLVAKLTRSQTLLGCLRRGFASIRRATLKQPKSVTPLQDRQAGPFL